MNENEIEQWRPKVEEAGERCIVQLPEEVVNRIAAGEVVQRPANAVKELVENSLDAGADRIEVTATGGGLTVLRIEDNGHGIRREDFPLLCVRFATSKLTKFDDLQSISTYGFRGEALASLSMVCRIEVTTRRKDTTDTFSARFREGVLKDDSRVPAGMNNQGTIIKATDMFYSMPQRRSMFSKPNEEYRLLVDVLSKYSIQYPRCSFLCRKAMGAAPDLSAMKSSDRTNAIRQIYGKDLADALLPITVRCDKLHFRAELYVSGLSYFTPKTEQIFFINGRLVNHEGLSRMIKTIYQPLLPRQAHPFVFVELNVKPEDVDVNAHPTKEKVIFLNEDEILSVIQNEVTPVLQRSLEVSGSLHLKRKLSDAEGSFGVSAALPKSTKTSESGTSALSYAHEMVRTDHLFEQGAMGKFMNKTASSAVTKTWWNTDAGRLTVVQNRLDSIVRSHDEELREALSKYVFVGWVNTRHILVQLDLGLYIVDSCVASCELFYQLCLASIGDVTRLRLSSPLGVRTLLELSPGASSGLVSFALSCLMGNARLLSSYFAIDISSDGVLESLPNILDGYTPPYHRLPLFLLRLAVEVDWGTEEGCVLGVAEEIANFYMLDDGAIVEEETKVEAEAVKNDEQKKEEEPVVKKPRVTHIAVPDLDSDGSSDDEKEHVPLAMREKKETIRETETETSKPSGDPSWVAQHVLYPAMKRSLLPPSNWKGTVFKRVADLPTMYKIFERC
eukprot:TRINITY_DN1545_c2_g1_i1.p1 TRINITY_DN1545_c2_g1~~TRINITY_DN1545_c2_g1_i1.p1  ORF type:complete len:749 (+),score=130.62 TRINITY_DN1545_c2_g1_i1:55-2247(+)